MLASIGRFGPYILFDKRYYTIPKTDDLLDISLERALAIMAEKNKPKDPNSKQKYTSAPDRVLGDHPKGGSVGLYKGRYGPYLKWDGGNYKLDKSLDPETCTLEEVMPALAGEATSTKKKVVAPARKKVAKKKK